MLPLALVEKPSRFHAVGLAVLVVAVLFYLESGKGFNLWDEGYFWYGVQRTVLGEVPIRDFMAYDPGRYYTSAALLKFVGSGGLVALRATAAVIQVVGLAVGLSLIAGSASRKSFTYLFLCAVTLVLWMFPYYKMVDIVTSILLIGLASRFVSRPNESNCFWLGFCVGLAAFFGRNHGLYGIVGSLGLMVWLAVGEWHSVGLGRRILCWAAGVVAGFVPIIGMALWIPDFGKAFWDSILFQFEIKTTNLPLPFPWPWRVEAGLPPIEFIRQFLIGCFFVGLGAFSVVAVIYVLLQRAKKKKVIPVLVAAAFFSFPYAHYAYSRADYYHLATGIFPLLIGCLAILSKQANKTKWPLASLLAVASILAMIDAYPGWQCRAYQKCVSVEISGRQFEVDPDTAGQMNLLRRLSAQYAPHGEAFVVTPFWPGAYALLERRSPMWESYAFFRHSEAFENAEIERIKAADPGFVLIFDHALDGQEALRFANTHPLINEYVMRDFERLPAAGRFDYQVFVKKGNPGLASVPSYLSASLAARPLSAAPDFKVVNWGPTRTEPAIVPNPQPDGTGGIWVKVAGEEGLGELQLYFNGKPAKSTAVAPGIITAAVDSKNFEGSGKMKVEIRQMATGQAFFVGNFEVAKEAP